MVRHRAAVRLLRQLRARHRGVRRLSQDGPQLRAGPRGTAARVVPSPRKEALLTGVVGSTAWRAPSSGADELERVVALFPGSSRLGGTVGSEVDVVSKVPPS